MVFFTRTYAKYFIFDAQVPRQMFHSSAKGSKSVFDLSQSVTLKQRPFSNKTWRRNGRPRDHRNSMRFVLAAVREGETGGCFHMQQSSVRADP